MPKYKNNFSIKKRLTQPVNSDTNTETNYDTNTETNTNKTYNYSINTNIDTYKNRIFKDYIQNKLSKQKNIKGGNKTPIYNSYIPGSGVGSSSIFSRRLKKKFAYLN